MKKQVTAVLIAALLCGCSTKQAAASAASSSTAPQSVDGDAYTRYTSAVTNLKKPDSYYAAVNSTYNLGYSDNTTELFVMDGTLEASGTSSTSVTAHTTQHISSKGTESDLSGWYYGGRFYNTYNNVNYYEDMSYSDLKKSMLVPMDAVQIQQNAIADLKVTQDKDGNTSYAITLNNDTAASLFTSRYDSYGLSQYDGYSITDNTITDTFSKEGYLLKEQADFTASVSYQSQTISVTYSSYVSYLRQNSTTVTVSDDTRNTNASYVNYADIDTSKITTESLIDDAAESTTAATFKKRLVGRLAYTDNGDGTYTDVFNESESYTIDFNTKVFKYTNHSIAYSYSWEGDTGSMGACTLIFDTGSSSSGCEDSTLTTIKDVKTYLEMELYYCGLSLEDLQAGK